MLHKYVPKRSVKKLEEEMGKIVHNHALTASIVMFLPLFGIGIIAFIVIFWRMYAKLYEQCNIKLTFKNIAVEIFVNILIYLTVGYALHFLSVIGWLGTSFMVYFQFYLSGDYFIEKQCEKNEA
jgi:hypothetical protein